MAMSAELRSKFAALYRQWSSYEWKILEWYEKPQRNKAIEYKAVIAIYVVNALPGSKNYHQ